MSEFKGIKKTNRKVVLITAILSIVLVIGSFFIGMHFGKQSAQTYLIKYLNYDGSLIEYQLVRANEKPQYSGSTPLKQQTSEFYYEFSGWDKALKKASKDEVYTAEFRSVRRKYLIKFLNYDNVVLQAIEVEYGQLPVYNGEIPSRDNTPAANYEFSGWDNPISLVTGETTYTAKFNAETQWYTIECEVNGVISSGQYAYGSIPLISNPSNYQDELKGYQFVGWDKQITTVTESTRYTAIFEEKNIFEFSGNTLTSLTTFGNTIKNITIPEYVNDAEISIIGDDVFRGNTVIESIVFSNKITKIGNYSFNGCTSLTNFVLPDSLKIIGSHTFNGCSSLTEIVISKNVTEIGTHAFANCSKVIYLTIKSNIEAIGTYAFGNMTKLQVVNFESTNMSDLSSGLNLFYNTGNESATGGIVVNVGKIVSRIPAYLFSTSTGFTPYITEVNFVEDMECVEIGNCAFIDLKYLTTVNIYLTPEEWDVWKINIGSLNDYFINATINCLSV